MKNGKSANFLNKPTWLRVRSILLCLLALVMVLSTALVVLVDFVDELIPERALIKSRLMRQIRYQGWDPYSESMTLDEYYALMELFDEGKLPLRNMSGISTLSDDEEEGTIDHTGLFIPRDKFLLSGLPIDLVTSGVNQPLEYDFTVDYEPYDPSMGELYTVIQVEGQADRYVLDSVTYVLSDTDGRLYDTTITSMVQYDYAFRLNGDYEKFYTRSDDDMTLYEVGTNKPYVFDSGSNLFTSLATGHVYIVDPQNGLWKYDENASGQYVSPFNETSGDYYYIDGQLYQFKNDALYDPLGVIQPYVKALAYKYPHGYGYENSYFKRPTTEWNGVEVRDKLQAVIVKEGINDDNYRVSGNVDQSFFNEYVTFNGYYVKQVSIDGANVNILGMIQVPKTDKYVYYYLSAEEQSTQVSTTTLSDTEKFLIEYVPSEYTIDFEVKIDTSNGEDSIANILYNTDTYANVADVVPQNVVFFGSNSATTGSWADGLFGNKDTRPTRTTDGAYSFDVTVPYGYEVQIIISVDRIIEGIFKDASGRDMIEMPNTFHVDANHTSNRTAIEDTWLTAYGSFVAQYGLAPKSLVDGEFSLAAFKSNYIDRTPNKDGDYRDYTSEIFYKWKPADDSAVEKHNEVIHNKALDIISERVNDIRMHNPSLGNAHSGNPLGKYPSYTVKDDFKILPDSTGPEKLTLNDTFYNHLVRADRKITAILKPLAAPVFDVREVIQKSTGVTNRGSIASYNNAMNADADYDYHVHGIGDSDPVNHSAGFPNVDTSDGWEWTKASSDDRVADRSKAVTMDQAPDGTYYYSWMFQTNSTESYFLDSFEVNGIAIQIPYLPKYNWNGTYKVQGQVEREADAKHPYYTETTLQDGSTLRLEFLLGWNEAQRHYRVTVTGARTNVVITGMNLMQYKGGAAEFTPYNLVGVYSDLNGESQTQDAIEFYGYGRENGAKGWTRDAESNIVVDNVAGNDNVQVADKEHYYANIRFKIAEGYGNPYYIWANRFGEPIADQTSAEFDDDGNIIDSRVPIPLAGVENLEGEGALQDGKLDPRYIYKGDDGYYYLRVYTQSSYRFALLTVVARTIKYTVRYTPEYDPNTEEESWYGFYIDPKTQELKPLTATTVTQEGKIFDLDESSMPITVHNPDTCELYEMAKDVLDEYGDVLGQYDDNGGIFYDRLYNSMAGIMSNSYGVIRPKDNNNAFTFVEWILVGEDFKPLYTDDMGNAVVIDPNTNWGYRYVSYENGRALTRPEASSVRTVSFSYGAIDINQYADFSVKHVAFGNQDTDIHVIRLMPVWKEVTNPYYYNVVVNWVDAKGELYTENYKNWDEVMTEALDGDTLLVYVNKDAAPFQDWIAQHPTYTFWDAVNNAITTGNDNEDKAVLQRALEDYLLRDFQQSNQKDVAILNALLKRDYTGRDDDGNEIEENGVADFDRLSNDIFRVNENGGTISIWMYESKGGLIFHKDVQDEPFIADDEFYFSILNVSVGESGQAKLSGEYKAYPQTYYNEEVGTWGFYDANGEFRAATDNDAWLVTFQDGNLVNVKKINSVAPGVPYFSLKHGEGIALYVPEGEYTIAEVGSKSGGLYKVSVEYSAADGTDITDDNMKLPEELDPDNIWLNGSSTQYYLDNVPAGVSQIPVSVKFGFGVGQVIQTLTFHNQTTSLSVLMKLHEDVLLPDGASMQQKNTWDATYNINYDFTVILSLPIEKTDGAGDFKYSPLEENIDGVTRYYFNINIYKVVNGENVGRTEKLYFTQITSSDSRYPSDAVDNANIWLAEFVLKPDETAAIVMQVMDGNVNYWVDEPVEASTEKLSNGLTPHWEYGKEGTAEAGKKASAKVVNYKDDPPEVTYGYLKITVSGDAQSNESFLFKITDEQGVSLIVSVKGGRSTYVYVPINVTYTIEEISGWSWRYGSFSVVSAEVTSSHSELGKAKEVKFNASPNNAGWLGGENSSNSR